MAEEEQFCVEAPSFFRVSFFRVLLPGFSSKLPIPRAVVKIIANERFVEGTSTLLSPDGKSWRIEIRAESDDFFFFGEGWRELTESLELDVGYFLVFCYEGDMVFSFEVFDSSGCGNNYPSQTPRSNLIVEAPTEKCKSRTSISKRMKESKILEARTEEHKSSTSKPKRMKESKILEASNAEHASACNPNRMSERKIAEARSEEHKGSHCARQSRASDEVQNSTDHNVSKVQFEITMGNTIYTGPYLHIPSSFRKSAGISVNDKEVNLRDPKGGNWLLGLYHRPGFRKTCILGGWRAFLRTNPLKIGDAYVFEMASRDKNGVINLRMHKRP